MVRKAIHGSVLRLCAAVLVLVAATWLYVGYRYEVGSQQDFLGNVLRFSGELENDWYTGFPPAHWVVDHAVAVVPESLRPAAVLGLWLTFLGVLWTSFISICRSLEAPLCVAVAAGLVLIATRIGGFGISEVLFDYFYPSNLAVALSVGSLAFLLRERLTLAGAALGMATLIHPQVGALMAIALAPVVLFARGRFDAAAALPFAVPFVLIGLPAVAQLMLDQTAGGDFSASERYDLVAVIRTPYHFVYSTFPSFEYVRTAIWFGVLVVSLIVMRELRAARLLAFLTGAIVVICAAGALAGEAGGPVMLVFAQTSRLSGVMVLLAVAVAAAALTRLLGPRLAVVALVGAFLAGPAAVNALQLDSWLEASSVSTAQALILAGVLVIAVVLTRAWKTAPPRTENRGVRAMPSAAVGMIFVAAFVSLVVEHDTRSGNATAEARLDKASPEVDALKEVASAAGRLTEPGELVLSSPDLDGVRVYAERPTVVEFGTLVFGEGDSQWKRRMIAMTGEPAALDPDGFGSDVPARARLLAKGYQRMINRSPSLICRYRARAVIARPLADPPRWLTQVLRNDYYALYGIRPGTCDPDPPSGGSAFDGSADS